MITLLAIVLLGLGTYFSRAVFILALGSRRIPPRVQLAMEYVGPSVMAALVATMLITPEGEIVLGSAEIVALIVAGLTAWFSRSHLLTLIIAMAVYWVL